MSIALTPSVESFFHEQVGAALKTRQVEATDGATSYLIALLSDFARPDAVAGAALERPLAFLLEEARTSPGPERFQKLRALGDGVLYVTGFFGDHIENRGVDVDYVVAVGQSAYDGAASLLRQRATMNVFAELAGKFVRFVEVLAEVGETTRAQEARGERGLLRLYERWLKTGSTSLAGELGSRGLVPVRGRGGVH